MPRKRQGKRIDTADGSVAVRGKAPDGAGSVYPTVDGSWRANWTDRAGSGATGELLTVSGGR